ncbi:MAG: TMEM43 family protein, partial [Akkermansiaceae bacterium]
PDVVNDEKLVYLTGEAVSEGTLSDPEFGISAEALRLKRTAKYFQWEEEVKTKTEKKLGGSEETVKTYSYEKKWVSSPIDSSKFNERASDKVNPPPAIKPQTWTANPVNVGGFVLSSGLKNQIDHFTALPLDKAAEMPEEIGGKKVQLSNAWIYLGENPNSPEVGDIRVTHQIALPGTVSVIAKQTGEKLESYMADAGGKIEMLETGEKSSASMFEAAHQSNKMMTWILRAVGFGVMFAGFGLLFKPLSVLADVVPLFGTIVGAGTGIISFLLTVVISFSVIAVAWIFYRPLIGVPLLIVAVVGLIFLVKKLMSQKKQQAIPI